MTEEIKPKILTIKKEAEKDIVYYYSRKKRMSLPGAPKPAAARKKGFFANVIKGNRIIKFLIADIIIVVILVIGLRVFFSYENTTGTVGNYNVEINTTVVKDRVFASLEVELKRITGRTEKELLITFIMKKSGIEKPVVLTLSGEKRDALEVILPYNGEERVLNVTVQAGRGKTGLLKRLK